MMLVVWTMMPRGHQSTQSVINCRIFRCGIMKSTGLQIDPHLPKPQCDALAETGEIHGCGKPFNVWSCGLKIRTTSMMLVVWTMMPPCISPPNQTLG